MSKSIKIALLSIIIATVCAKPAVALPEKFFEVLLDLLPEVRDLAKGVTYGVAGNAVYNALSTKSNPEPNVPSNGSPGVPGSAGPPTNEPGELPTSRNSTVIIPFRTLGTWPSVPQALLRQRTPELNRPNVVMQAIRGDANAEDRLGYIDATRLWGQKYYNAAAYWFERAAEQGDADGESNLAVLYQTGEGEPQDYGKAAAWYEKATTHGSIIADYGLGLLYYTGQGVTEDRVKARRLIAEAAGGGLAAAQIWLKRNPGKTTIESAGD